jgi:hypothetical protein
MSWSSLPRLAVPKGVVDCPYDRRVSREKRLTVVLLLNLVLVTALVLVGLLAHSLGSWRRVVTTSPMLLPSVSPCSRSG